MNLPIQEKAAFVICRLGASVVARHIGTVLWNRNYDYSRAAR